MWKSSIRPCAILSVRCLCALGLGLKKTIFHFSGSWEMYGLQGGAVNLILLLVSDIDDNFWFLTGHSTEKLVIINKTSFVTTPQPPPPPSLQGLSRWRLRDVWWPPDWRPGCCQSYGWILAGFTQFRWRTVRWGGDRIFIYLIIMHFGVKIGLMWDLGMMLNRACDPLWRLRVHSTHKKIKSIISLKFFLCLKIKHLCLSFFLWNNCQRYIMNG